MKIFRRFFSLALTALLSALMSLAAFASSPFEMFKIKDLSDLSNLLKDPLSATIIIAAAVVIVVLIVAIARAAAKSKRKKKANTTKAEEAPVEDAPAVTETVVEEAPAKEAPAVTETVVEEIPAKEAPALNPTCLFPELDDSYSAPEKDIPAEAVDQETGCTYTFDENGLPVAPDGKVIRYKWSFLGRLSQAPADVKADYLTLRNTLLAYKKMRSNISWNFDSYFIGRKTVAKLKIRGKNLVVYFPLDPKEMEGTKYLGEDASGISRYKAVPFAYAINGTRKLKYAIELIEKIAEGKPAKEPESVDKANINASIPEQSFDALYTRGLIRIGGFINVGAKTVEEDD